VSAFFFLLEGRAIGFFDKLKGLFGSSDAVTRGTRPVAELARRLGMSEEELRTIEPAYQEFTIAKRSGSKRRILSPAGPLKAVQRRILRRLLGRLRSHPAAQGFEKGRSIVTHALPHVGQAVVLCMDLRDFFETTSARRVRDFFGRLGWNREAVAILERLCTYRGGLPQGAPTSPRLSNLLNVRMDTRLAAMAAHCEKGVQGFRNPRTGDAVIRSVPRAKIQYTRYADDLTLSFTSPDRQSIHAVLWLTRQIVRQEGYELHIRKKLRIRRRHHQQLVTGLVVNQAVNLPRTTRRWLRAIEHHLLTGKPTTLNAGQVAGWRAFVACIKKQAAESRGQQPGK
jgi:hypothetical protein